jgi:hypothetical protein
VASCPAGRTPDPTPVEHVLVGNAYGDNATEVRGHTEAMDRMVAHARSAARKHARSAARKKDLLARLRDEF